MDDNGIDTERKPRRKARELSATQRALGLLTRREHSRTELTRKLASRGMDAGEVETAVANLARDGWQDDARFAESLMRARASSGHGPIRIRAELATHGLDREAITAALDTFHGDWAEIASDLVRRRYGPVAAFDLNQRRKAADFLLRRGFDAAAIRAATRADADAD
ncbi:regulatory protein RecX [Lysobacter solisilvae (ex Woo and Kim 2020)]|uniref:Regulatory protein RecX n=1 Tax=Agrilutibacter terrestris TaxID=2865112 RepID=A0A7H0FWA6_9GAMM|nr:regulatory protein RecX [Lysobacter terrestris]QNP40322.1 regulatory protein RecX [Lysobacter terrestris]